MTSDPDSIRLYAGVATFASSAFTGMLLMATPKQRLAMTLLLVVATIFLMSEAP